MVQRLQRVLAEPAAQEQLAQLPAQLLSGATGGQLSKSAAGNSLRNPPIPYGRVAVTGISPRQGKELDEWRDSNESCFAPAERGQGQSCGKHSMEPADEHQDPASSFR